MKAESDWVALQRDCTATTVPWGERVELSADGEVQVIQQLGGSVTVQTAMGMLLRRRRRRPGRPRTRAPGRPDRHPRAGPRRTLHTRVRVRRTRRRL